MMTAERAGPEHQVSLSLPLEVSRSNSIQSGEFRILHAKLKEPKATRA
jgi:hypothetical protein